MAVPTNLKNKIKLAYLSGLTVAEILAKYEVRADTLRNWINKGSKFERPWNEIKESEKEAKAFVENLESDEFTIRDLIVHNLSVLRRGVTSIEDTGQQLGIDAILKMAKINDYLIRWEQHYLDQGEDYENLTDEDIDKIDESNPFGGFGG